MKKLISFGIALAMLVSMMTFTMPAQAMGENEGFPMLYETFESEAALKNVSTAGPCSATLSISDDGYNGSSGSLHFLQTAGTDYVDIGYTAGVGGLKVPDGEKLKLRMKIKSNVELANNYFTFIFYGGGTISDPGSTGKQVGEKAPSGWLEIVFSNVMKYGEWVVVEKDIVWGEQTLTVGSGSKLTDVTLDRLAIRVGNRSGINTDVKGEKLDYQIDDLSLVLAPSGDFTSDSVGSISSQSYTATNTPANPSKWGNPDMTTNINFRPGRLYKITGNFRCDTLPDDTEGYTDDMKPTKANLRLYWLAGSRLDNGLATSSYPSTYFYDLKLNEDNNLTIYYIADGQTFSFPEGFALKFRMYTDAKDRTWKDGSLQATSQGGANAGTAGKFTYSNVTYEDLGMATGINHEIEPGAYYVRNSKIMDTEAYPVPGFDDNGACNLEIMNEDGNRFVKTTGTSNYGSLTSGGVQMKNKHTYRISVKAKTEGLAEGESKPFTVVLNSANSALQEDADYPYKHDASYIFLNGNPEYPNGIGGEKHKWFVTNEWQTFTMDYTVSLGLKDGMSESAQAMPITPRLQFRVGANAEQMGAVTYLDDISVTDMGILDDSLMGNGKYATVSDMTFEKVGKSGIKVDYTYNPYVDEKEDRAQSLIRAFIETENGDRNIGTFQANEVFQVPASALGEKISYEVIPVSTEGVVGNGAIATSEYIFDLLIGKSLTVNTAKTEATWKVDVDAADANANGYLVGLAAYDTNNQLVASDLETCAVNAGSNSFGDTFSIPAEAVKLKLFIWDAVTLAPQDEVLEKALPAPIDDPFAGDDEVNIVFVGDSIYANAGAGSEQNGFVYQVGEWMKENYAQEGRTINWYNTSYGGTTTDYTFVRFQRDVIAKDPDMVFFCMTCNDGSGTETIRNAESCMRMLAELDNKPYVVLTLLTNRGFGNSTVKTEQIANFYGLPYFDNFEAQRKAVAAGTPVEDLYTNDGVHPNPAGYKVIADALNEWIGTNRNFARPLNREDKLVENSGTIDAMEVFSAKDSRVTRTGDWEEGGNYLVTRTTGSVLEFDFTGDILCFETALHQYAGKIEVYIDDEYVWTDNPYYNMAGHQMTVRNGNFNFDLEPGDHHVVLKVVDGDNTAEQMETRIYNIFAGSWK